MFATIGLKSDEFNKGIEEAGKKGEKLAEGLTKHGKALSAGISAPLLAIGTAAFASANSIEDAFFTIRRSTGATGDELESLKKSFSTVFVGVPDSARSVSSVLSSLSTATGLTGEKLEHLTTTTLKYARVNNEDAGESAITLGRLMNALDIDAAELSSVMDKLTFASQKSGLSVNSLSEYIIAAGPSFEEMGFGLDRSIALFSSFYKAGAEPRELLSSLNIVLNRMAKDGSTNAEEAFNDLLTSIKDAPDMPCFPSRGNTHAARAAIS